jgi:hypothetical protein
MSESKTTTSKKIKIEFFTRQEHGVQVWYAGIIGEGEQFAKKVERIRPEELVGVKIIAVDTLPHNAFFIGEKVVENNTGEC